MVNEKFPFVLLVKLSEPLLLIKQTLFYTFTFVTVLSKILVHYPVTESSHLPFNFGAHTRHCWTRDSRRFEITNIIRAWDEI